MAKEVSSLFHQHNALVVLCNHYLCIAKVFDKMQQAYDVIELDQMSDGDTIQAALKEITGIRTVWILFCLHYFGAFVSTLVSPKSVQ